MKNYRITVNGTAYDVAVEEIEAGSAPSAPVAAPKAAAPKAAPAPAPAAPAASSGAGSISVTAPMPGKILAVKKGDVVLILEAMKMENEVVAPEDGTIASIDVTVGTAVESGDTLATLN